MSTIVCLGGGIEGLPILERVKALGHRLVVVDGNPDAPGRKLSQYFIEASCYDAKQTINQLARLAGPSVARDRAWPYDGILCCAIDAPNVAAAVAARFGLPGLTVAQAALSCDKVDQFMQLAKADLPVPPDAALTFYGAVDTPHGLLPLDLNPYNLEKLGDVVIKPADSRGGRGVQLLHLTPDETDEHKAVWDACAYARQFSVSGKLIAEKFLSGPQFSTESLVQDGHVLWTGIALRNYDRLEEYAPHIIEDGFDAPYGEDDFRDQIEILLERACRALGWFQQGGGVVKGDLVLHDNDLYIIELAARLSGGFLSTHGWPLAYGMPFVEYAIRLSLAKSVHVTDDWNASSFVAQRYVFPKPEWIGRKVVYDPKILTHDFPYTTMPRIWIGRVSPTKEYPGQVNVKPYPDIEFASWNFHAGHVIRPVTDHAARLGQAIAVGNTPEQARARASAAVEAMREGLVVE